MIGYITTSPDYGNTTYRRVSRSTTHYTQLPLLIADRS